MLDEKKLIWKLFHYIEQQKTRPHPPAFSPHNGMETGGGKLHTVLKKKKKDMEITLYIDQQKATHQPFDLTMAWKQVEKRYMPY